MPYGAYFLRLESVMKKLTALALSIAVVCLLAFPAMAAVQSDQETSTVSWWGVVWDGFLELLGLKSVTAPPLPTGTNSLEDPPPPPPESGDGRGTVDPDG
jgi:hypothetical protein